MENRSTGQPALSALFGSFMKIGLAAFGGGLAAWTRQEVVQKRGWMDDKQFLSGYALSQLIPGATNVNLAVFIGTQMRGAAGALACFLGLTAAPLLIVLVAGYLYLHSQGQSSGGWVGATLEGMGAVAIGLSLGIGVKLGKRNIRGLVPIAVVTITAVSIGLLGYSLVHVLLVMMPASLMLTWIRRPR